MKESKKDRKEEEKKEKRKRADRFPCPYINGPLDIFLARGREREDR